MISRDRRVEHGVRHRFIEPDRRRRGGAAIDDGIVREQGEPLDLGAQDVAIAPDRCLATGAAGDKLSIKAQIGDGRAQIMRKFGRHLAAEIALDKARLLVAVHVPDEKQPTTDQGNRDRDQGQQSVVRTRRRGGFHMPPAHRSGEFRDGRRAQRGWPMAPQRATGGVAQNDQPVIDFRRGGIERLFEHRVERDLIEDDADVTIRIACAIDEGDDGLADCPEPEPWRSARPMRKLRARRKERAAKPPHQVVFGLHCAGCERNHPAIVIMNPEKAEFVNETSHPQVAEHVRAAAGKRLANLRDGTVRLGIDGAAGDRTKTATFFAASATSRVRVTA